MSNEGYVNIISRRRKIREDEKKRRMTVKSWIKFHYDLFLKGPFFSSFFFISQSRSNNSPGRSSFFLTHMEFLRD